MGESGRRPLERNLLEVRNRAFDSKPALGLLPEPDHLAAEPQAPVIQMVTPVFARTFEKPVKQFVRGNVRMCKTFFSSTKTAKKR